MSLDRLEVRININQGIWIRAVGLKRLPELLLWYSTVPLME